MVDPIDICKICLRTDVNLIEIDKVLLSYHYAITDFALFHVDSRYCRQCEYQLKKSYNFKTRCESAAKILQEWHQNMVQGKTNRKSLENLHKEVSQLSLKICPQKITIIYKHTEEPTTIINQDYTIQKLPEDNIKKEIDDNFTEINCNDLATLKNETNTFQEILIENHFNCLENDKELVNEDDKQTDDEINDVGLDDAARDESSLSSDDECLAAKKLRNKMAGLKRTKKDIKSVPKLKRTKTKRVKNTECSINSDTDSDTDISMTKSDSDIEKKTDNDIKQIDDEVESIKSEKNIVGTLKAMTEDLNLIYENWEKTSLTELPVVTFDKYDSTTKRCLSKKKSVREDLSKGKRKGVMTKLTDLSADLDSIRENCAKLINYKEGLMNPKERLRAELTSKFSSSSELKTEDGFVINKECIMKCFDRVSECLMKRLWRFVHGKATLESRAINTLKHIQKKYQNEHQYESVFTIEYLNTKEKVAEEFEKRQTYECYLNAKYKCEMCYLGFKYEAQMENHKNSHEESSGGHVCPTCGVRHKSKKSLDTHSKSHEAVYKCKLCPLVTYYRYSMMNHYHQHEGLEYKCEQCDTTFRSKSAYKTHCGLRHSGGGAACTLCGRSLASRRALAWHAARVHKRDPETVGSPVPCVPCDLKFASQQAYLRHARNTHTTVKYTTQKAQEGAPKKKPIHVCRVCDAVGNSIGWLTLHFRLEHPTVDMALTYADKQNHLCEICGKGYANVYNLRDHLSIHAGVRAHACPTCGARFHRAVSLAQHTLTHQPPARACPACGKRFHSQSNLNNHMRGHTGDRRYKCNLCGKGFLHRNALNEHVRGVHYKLRRVRKRTLDKLSDVADPM